MIRSRKRIWLCGSLVILNVLFIWGNSMLSREASAAISRFVGRLLDSFVSEGPTLSDGEGHGILRKIAHATEFCSLGILLSWGVRMLREKLWEFMVYPACIGVAVASIDEIIQMYVPGRGPHIRDVGIDSIGVILGVLMVALIVKLRSGSMKNKI